MQGRFKMEYRLFTIVRYNYNYRDYNKQAGREASWLKQVRKVKKAGESEKWVTSDKTQGGEE